MPLLTPKTQRRGFSMIEILIVITVITVLITLTAVVLSNSIQQARIQATKATLTKVDGLLQQRMEAFRVMIDSPQWQSTLQSKLAAKHTALQNAGITGMQTKMLQMLVYKDAFRRAFPQTLADNPGLGNPGQPFNANQIASPTPKQIAAESSEMLYWILTKSDSFGVPPVDDSEFSASEIGDMDGDGLKEFVDSWGEPLRFYRWPTRLLRPGAPVTPVNRQLALLLMSGLPSPSSQTGDLDPLTQDPDDQLGVYIAAVNSNVITPVQYENLYHTPDTYWVPLIVSGGPNKSTGLYEPYDTSNFGRLAMPIAITLDGDLNDDLTNRQKQK